MFIKYRIQEIKISLLFAIIKFHYSLLCSICSSDYGDDLSCPLFCFKIPQLLVQLGNHLVLGHVFATLSHDVLQSELVPPYHALNLQPCSGIWLSSVQERPDVTACCSIAAALSRMQLLLDMTA